MSSGTFRVVWDVLEFIAKNDGANFSDVLPGFRHSIRFPGGPLPPVGGAACKPLPDPPCPVFWCPPWLHCLTLLRRCSGEPCRSVGPDSWPHCPPPPAHTSMQPRGSPPRGRGRPALPPAGRCAWPSWLARPPGRPVSNAAVLLKEAGMFGGPKLVHCCSSGPNPAPTTGSPHTCVTPPRGGLG